MKNNIISFYNIPKDRGAFMCKILKKIKNKTPYELLKEYEINQTPPINISKLVEKIGITIIANDFSEIEEIQGVEPNSILGAAFSINDDLAIFYKSSDSLHRKKFTIAHELAHCCLDCPDNVATHLEYRIDSYMDLNDEQLKKERRANIFAGELLIPENILRETHKKMLIPSLSELSMIFDVSTSVMAARLDYLQMSYFKDSITEIIL